LQKRFFTEPLFYSQKMDILMFMETIKKKVWPEYFEAIVSGKKKFELRLHDFDVKEGDMLVLEEWDPTTKAYTGRSLEKKVTYIIAFKPDELTFWPKEDVQEKGLQIISFE
jgi:ASC-1-like (ASCH) protein